MIGRGSWDDCSCLRSVLVLDLAHVLAPDPARDSVPVPAPALSLALASAAEEPRTLGFHRTVRAAEPAGLLEAAAARSTAVVAVAVVVAVVVSRNCTLVAAAAAAAAVVVDAAAVVGRPGYPVSSPLPDHPVDRAV